MELEIIQKAYGEYWDTVKNEVDENDWAYNNNLPHLIDCYFGGNIGKEIDFEKSYEGPWKGCRWRLKELSDLL